MNAGGGSIVAETGEVDLALMNIRSDHGFGRPREQLTLGPGKVRRQKQSGGQNTFEYRRHTLSPEILLSRFRVLENPRRKIRCAPY